MGILSAQRILGGSIGRRGRDVKQDGSDGARSAIVWIHEYMKGSNAMSRDIIKDKPVEFKRLGSKIQITIECSSDYESKVMFEHFKDALENGEVLKIKGSIKKQ